MTFADGTRYEMPMIEKIIENECWLEGERRGEPVNRKDPVVINTVADIILNGEGKRMRDMFNKR